MSSGNVVCKDVGIKYHGCNGQIFVWRNKYACDVIHISVICSVFFDMATQSTDIKCLDFNN